MVHELRNLRALLTGLSRVAACINMALEDPGKLSYAQLFVTWVPGVNARGVCDSFCGRYICPSA